MVRVKVCGITRLEDALFAADLGVAAVGFNFVPESPRRITADQARAIAAALPPFVTRVGVFADAPGGLLEETARRAGLHCLQLHGDEPPEACRDLPRPWYKAFRVGPGFDPAIAGRYGNGTFLLDAAVPGAKGGTGVPFDWEVARRAAAFGRVILAGGLTPGNVAAAIAAARPWAVDVSSGVEAAPGRKDPERLRDFMARVREAEREGGGAR